MAKTTANFRAIREVCGITQQFAADALGVRVLAVKRWENGMRSVPDYAMAWLLECAAEHDAGVEDDMKRVLSGAGAGDEICMRYYRTQEQADIAAYPERAGHYQFLNAITRSAAERLKALGYRVSFTYPDEERRYDREI